MSGAGAAWMTQARHDLAVAERLLATGVAYDWAAYAAQQASEKALKGLLITIGHEAPRTHDLVALMEDVRRACDLPPALAASETLDLLAELTQFNVVARYPLSPDTGAPADRITRRQAAQACDTARRVVAAATDLTESGGTDSP